ncbi:MAG: hypothetical protein HQK56_15450 [Deltaproteobacteria bacterium]|nr:hypothetical protein [Deltaproteobacteria bacterium]
MRYLIILSLLMLPLVGCAGMSNNQMIGTAAGAALGAGSAGFLAKGLGANGAIVAASALAGAAVGGVVGNVVTKPDPNQPRPVQQSANSPYYEQAQAQPSAYQQGYERGYQNGSYNQPRPQAQAQAPRYQSDYPNPNQAPYINPNTYDAPSSRSTYPAVYNQ